MSKIPFSIISSGSEGNAVVINASILVDCGVSFKALSPYYDKLKLVLLTHIHSDHFQKSTIRALARARPTLRFACGNWLVPALVDAEVPKENIDPLQPNVMYGYGICNVIPVQLVHNVPNCGWKIHFTQGKVFYATDTNNLNGIVAKSYDLYMVEANYIDAEIQEKIREKRASGEYAYEVQVLHNHLSKAKCDDFIYRDISPVGEYVYLHCHKDKTEAEK